VHAARKQDRRLAAALLAAALAHTPEAEEVLRGARTRMARKPPALARELLRNFPKRRARGQRRRRKGQRAADRGTVTDATVGDTTLAAEAVAGSNGSLGGGGEAPSDAVLAEALSADAERPPPADTELAAGSERKLERSVENALEPRPLARRRLVRGSGPPPPHGAGAAFRPPAWRSAGP
jgi:hypothetical protein